MAELHPVMSVLNTFGLQNVREAATEKQEATNLLNISSVITTLVLTTFRPLVGIFRCMHGYSEYQAGRKIEGITHIARGASEIVFGSAIGFLVLITDVALTALRYCEVDIKGAVDQLLGKVDVVAEDAEAE